MNCFGDRVFDSEKERQVVWLCQRGELCYDRGILGFNLFCKLYILSRDYYCR